MHQGNRQLATCWSPALFPIDGHISFANFP